MRGVSKQSNTGQCIFCGKKGGLTKQHIFSDWLRQIIPRNPAGSLHYKSPSRFVRPGSWEHRKQVFQSYQGDVGSRKIRNVCASCNGGWISVIEGNVKPVLSRLIMGDPISMSNGDKLEVAKWVVVTSIMAEYAHPRDRSIQHYHRTYLMRNLRPSDGWQIWIGKYDGKDDKIVYRHGGGLYFTQSEFDPKVLSNSEHPGLYQCTTIVLDRLFIIAATLPDETIRAAFRSDLTDFSHKLTQLWPRKGSGFTWLTKLLYPNRVFHENWPTSESLLEKDVLTISNILADIHERINAMKGLDSKSGLG